MGMLRHRSCDGTLPRWVQAGPVRNGHCRNFAAPHKNPTYKAQASPQAGTAQTKHPPGGKGIAANGATTSPGGNAVAVI
jgi:hypothetical protein